MAPLIVLGDESQRTPIDLDVDDLGQVVLRLRPGIPVTAGIVRVLNDLLAEGEEDSL